MEAIEKFLSILKPHVTTFSAELPLKYKANEEVVVGGTVVSVFDSNLLDDNFNQPYESGLVTPDEDMGVYIVVDDMVGQTLIVTFQTAYVGLLALTGKTSLVGEIIVAEGKHAVMSKATDYITMIGGTVKIDNHPDKEQLPKVFAHDISILQLEE